MRVRKMTKDDVDAVYEIEVATFANPWTKESIAQEVVENLMAVYMVIEVDERVIGYAGMWTVVDELHITNVAVSKAYQGLGYGKALMDALIDYGRAHGFLHMTLEVRVSNARAIKLYEAYGFIGVGTRPKYYIDNDEDALVMWKEL